MPVPYNNYDLGRDKSRPYNMRLLLRQLADRNLLY